MPDGTGAGMKTRIYLADCRVLEDQALAECLPPMLPAARQEKLTRLREGQPRRLSLGAGLLLVHALREEGLHPADYTVDSYGRPSFPSLPDFHFSLSHSGETAMCAVSAKAIGCDVEERRSVDLRLAERFFHPDEWAYLSSLPQEAREEDFFRLWTRKESYMKALGLGFSLPLSSFALRADGADALLAGGDGQHWFFRSFKTGENTYCAVCSRDAETELPVIRVDFRALWGKEAAP